MGGRTRWWGRPPHGAWGVTHLTPPLLRLLVAVLLVPIERVGSSSNADGPLKFEDILPENPRDYDKMAPPRDVGQATIVYFHVTVMSLDSIDESSMTYAADIFFAQSWKDWRLKLPDNMTHEYRLLPVMWLKDIWRPDSFFKNAKAVTFQEMTIPNHYIWLYQDKTILYMVKLTLVLSCAMNFQVYPHDTQECSMKIESLSHTTADLVFMWDPEVPLVVDQRIELPQLDLVKNITGDCTQVYSTGNFTCLEIIFTFKRRLGYYLFHTYIPTCLIVIMSWISFWIRPEAVPARVTLGVTSLLTLSTQHANSQKSLPPVSYIKAIDVFMSSCTVFVFFSLMEYALVNVVLGDVTEETEKRKRPRTLLQITSHQEEAPKKLSAPECLGLSLANPVDDSPVRSIRSGGGASQTTTPTVTHRSTSSLSHRNTPPSLTHRVNHTRAVAEKRANGRKLTCPPSELEAITTIASPVSSPVASPLNGISPVEAVDVVQPPAASSAVSAPSTSSAASSSTSCPAHVVTHAPLYTPASQPLHPHLTHTQHHLTSSPHYTLGGHITPPQHGVAFNLPPPPPPPPMGGGGISAKVHQIQQRRREKAILIDRLSRIIFPCSFTVLNIIYWSVFYNEWS
ncbi:glycine receptor subunit alpha-4-like [Oratosquilla oratoria]|uniref:glycine receptor subunit alpha-4-like n=1 Tax=Oratosquilla oratoria TaxID=337810 RepID=UPI003F76E23B